MPGFPEYGFRSLLYEYQPGADRVPMDDGSNMRGVWPFLGHGFQCIVSGGFNVVRNILLEI